MLFPRLSLLLLLLPALVQAQLPPPLVWSMVASSCVPDESSLPYWRATANQVTFLLAQFAPARRGAHLPLLVRCPINPPLPQALANQLEVTYRDPDGAEDGARLTVQLRRQLLPAPRPGPWVPDVLATFDTRFRASDPLQVVTVVQPIGTVAHDFTTATYWLELGLSRSSLAVPPPRIYVVRLRYVPQPPE